MENLFESLNNPDSVFFLLSILVSFLIGFISAWAMWSGQAKRYQREAADWKKKYEDLNLELNALREKLDLKTADLAKAKRELELALEQATTVQAEKLKWQKDLDSSLEETVRLQAASHAYQATIDDLNGQVAGLKSQNEQLALAPVVLGTGSGQDSDKIAALEASNAASLERLTALEAQIATLTTENETLRATSGKEDENMVNLLNSYKDSTNRLGTLEASMDSLMAENEALKAELAALRTAAATEAPSLGAIVDAPILATINPADKEAITSGAISPSDAKNEVLAAIGNTIPTATADQRDDLTEIKGIGSFLEKKLNALGIFTYAQVAALDANLMDKLTTAIEFFPGRIERDDWVGQAQRLAQPQEENKAKPKAKAAKGDDLKIVEGIGPKIELLLHGAGIHSLEDLANTSVERLKEVLNKAGDRYRIHDPSTWPSQARLAADGELGKLKEYQEFLSGGKDPA
ncbi:MAG: helix-hairpin-helix domain-containing protein [Saprospiraceae bacterium]|jgi:predicted flap endonuclease-1-like 5' DNA nuclease|nr:helix-hairpin-helix domain-containing protein [Saprospiraceae bacterium]